MITALLQVWPPLRRPPVSPTSAATLAGLVVADAYRRRGVGTMLLTAVETTARSWGCVRLELTSSRSRTAAHDLYLAFGFEETSERQARYVRALDQQVADLELELG